MRVLLICFFISLLVSLEVSAKENHASDNAIESCCNLAKIPAGNYLMGASAEEYESLTGHPAARAAETPVHSVKVNEFYLSKFVVTRGEFSNFAKQTKFASAGCTIFKNGQWKFDSTASWENPGFDQTSNDPVVCVSWEDAKKYIAWLNKKIDKKSPEKLAYRLPTEEEWEYAARAGTVGPTYWSGSAASQCRYSNTRDISSAKIFGDQDPNRVNCDDGYASTSPVDAFPGNPWRLFDMLGNVYQWTESCSDSYGTPVRTTEQLQSITCSMRMVRGASWATVPFAVQLGHRGAMRTTDRISTTGFRVAASIQH